VRLKPSLVLDLKQQQDQQQQDREATGP
jgi:hypothetical protein